MSAPAKIDPDDLSPEIKAEIAWETWLKQRGMFFRERRGFNEFRKGFMLGLAEGEHQERKRNEQRHN
jgi:hypothetical protein